MSIIVAHTRIGKAFVHAASVFTDEQDFIEACQSVRVHADPEINTTEDALKYMHDSFQNVSKIITQDSYVIGESDLIDEKANKLGWNDSNKVS